MGLIYSGAVWRCISAVVFTMLLIACGGQTVGTNAPPVPGSSSSSTSSSSSSGESGEVAPPRVVIEEAGEGYCRIQGTTDEVEHTGFTGAAYSNPENTLGAGITWQVNSAEAGYFDLILRFANGSDAARPGDIVIEGGVEQQLAFERTGEWTNWQTEVVNVFLEQGRNTLNLVSTGNSGLPNIDSLTVIGDGVQAADCSDLPEEPEPVDSSGACVAGATLKDTTVDCGGKTLGLNCVGDSESQPAVLTLENATVKNLRIAANGGSDGIHCTAGDCVLENVVWEDVCEDAATLKGSGRSLTIIGGSAYNDSNGPGGKPDKIFQHNNRNSTLTIKGGFVARGQHGKLWRSCGNCTNNGGPRHLVIDGVDIDASIGSIAGANGNYGDTVKINNLKIKNYREGSPKVCEEYIGVDKSSGQSSQKIGERWQTITCQVGRSDVVAF